MAYPCGRDARDALRRLIGGRAVTCEGWERDRYGRLLAFCKAGAVDLNRALVEQGWAVAFGDFQAEEFAARQAARGLWAGDFDRPRQWRDTHGSMTEADHGASAGMLRLAAADCWMGEERRYRMKLYDGGRAPSPRRVRIFLAEKGIEVPLVPIDMGAMGHESQEVTERNPLQRLPVLELDDGTVLTETVAICRYFEELYPEPALFGRGALGKARVEMWQRRLELNLFSPWATLFGTRTLQ